MKPGSDEFLKRDCKIAEMIADRNKRIIIEQIKEMTDPTCNFSRIKSGKSFKGCAQKTIILKSLSPKLMNWVSWSLTKVN